MQSSDLLQAWLAKLASRSPVDKVDLGLERMRQVGARLGCLRFHCPVVMVAGTNGKGSTVATLGKLLTFSAVKVGTYTSPHLFAFQERIQINGVCVAPALLCAAFTKVENASQGIPLSFFEFTTLAAFTLFQQVNVQLLLLEVGLGGRLDAVNVIDPDIAVITSIGLDHEALLGDTKEAIAKEKAGILREGIPVVLGGGAKVGAIFSRIEALKNPLYLEGRDFHYCQMNPQRWHWMGKVSTVPVHYLPSASASLALAIYTILGRDYFLLPDLNAAVQVLADMRMLGRFSQCRLNNKNIIFDVAHNVDGGRWLAQGLSRLGAKRRRAVWASVKDKALDAIVASVSQHIDAWYIGELEGVARGAECSALQAALNENEVERVHVFPSIQMAFSQALADTDEGDEIVIFGSFYTVEQALKKYSTYFGKYQENYLLYTLNET